MAPLPMGLAPPPTGNLRSASGGGEVDKKGVQNLIFFLAQIRLSWQSGEVFVSYAELLMYFRNHNATGG